HGAQAGARDPRRHRQLPPRLRAGPAPRRGCLRIARALAARHPRAAHDGASQEPARPPAKKIAGRAVLVLFLDGSLAPAVGLLDLTVPLADEIHDLLRLLARRDVEARLLAVLPALLLEADDGDLRIAPGVVLLVELLVEEHH